MGYADELQAVSVDEALIDVSSAVTARALAPEEAADDSEEGVERSEKPRDAAVEIAEMIRDDVRKLTEGCEGKSLVGLSRTMGLSARSVDRHRA